MQMREKSNLMNTKESGMDPVRSLLMENDLKAADPTLLTDLDTLGSQLKYMSHESKVF